MIKLGFILLAMAMYSTGEDKFHFFGHEFDRTPLGDAIDHASVKLLKEIYIEANPADKNVVASPLAVLILLSLYSAGAGENQGIKDEIVKALGSSDYDDLYKSYTRLTDKFSAMDADYLTLANKIYIDEKFEVLDEFSAGAVRSYHSEIEKVKFSDPPSAVAVINRWSDEKTKGHIKKPLSEKDVDPSTVAALVNVIFFQGHWDIPFNASETQDKDFYVSKSEVVKKPMMHLAKTLFYHESKELGAKLVELPYTEKGFRMVIILPDEVEGLPSLLEKVEKRGLLSDIFSLEPSNVKVILDMPKFEIKTGLNLKNLLMKMGVSKIFSESATGIVKGSVVSVSEAIQKAFVKVDEKGATAGAFTGFIMVGSSMGWKPPPPIIFNVDHPFLFAILHEDTVLFLGTYTH